MDAGGGTAGIARRGSPLGAPSQFEQRGLSRGQGGADIGRAGVARGSCVAGCVCVRYFRQRDFEALQEAVMSGRCDGLMARMTLR